jgi:hypothetical protein
MASTYKAIAVRDELASAFSIRIPTLAQVKSFDTNGNPALLVGAASTGNEGFYVKISPVASLGFDVIGNAQTNYSNHVAQIVFEANYAGTTDSVADVQKWASKLPAIALLARLGMRVEVYEETNGTAPVDSSIAAGKLKASFEPSVQFGIIGDM